MWGCAGAWVKAQIVAEQSREVGGNALTVTSLCRGSCSQEHTVWGAQHNCVADEAGRLDQLGCGVVVPCFEQCSARVAAGAPLMHFTPGREGQEEMERGTRAESPAALAQCAAVGATYTIADSVGVPVSRVITSTHKQQSWHALAPTHRPCLTHHTPRQADQDKHFMQQPAHPMCGRFSWLHIRSIKTSVRTNVVMIQLSSQLVRLDPQPARHILPQHARPRKPAVQATLHHKAQLTRLTATQQKRPQ